MHTNVNQKKVININGHGPYVELFRPPNALAIVLLHHGLGSTLLESPEKAPCPWMIT